MIVRRTAWRAAGVAAAVGLCAGVLWAGKYTGTQQGSRLYTKPESSAGGGIRGSIAEPRKAIVGVYAISQSDYRKVYEGTVGGSEFTFSGLPTGKYDLLVVFPDSFHDGVLLNRESSTLTSKDLQSISSNVMRATPFFDTKKIHRCEGVTGHAGKARAVLQEVRTRPVTLQDASVRSDIQIRSIKVALLEDVNLGWSITETREVIRQEVGGSEMKGVLPNYFNARLGNIRVIDTVKDLGELNLAGGAPRSL